MKIISLISLTAGTGICHYISSFSMIEKEEMVIIDLDTNSILENILTPKYVDLEKNSINNDISTNDQLEEHATRFNNVLITISAKNFKTDQLESILECTISRFSNENYKYLILHYPYVYKDSVINKVISCSDYTVLFADYTFEAKLAMTDILKKQSNNTFGLFLTKPENTNFSIIELKKELSTYQIELLGEMPYNLLFQLASIQKKVLLEFDDHTLSDSIIKLWDRIRSNVNSTLKESIK